MSSHAAQGDGGPFPTAQPSGGRSSLPDGDASSQPPASSNPRTGPRPTNPGASATSAQGSPASADSPPGVSPTVSLDQANDDTARSQGRRGSTHAHLPGLRRWTHFGWWFGVLALLLLAIRLVGVWQGLLYDPDATRLWEISFVIFAVAFLLFPPRRLRPSNDTAGRFERALFFLGLPVALIALLAYTMPPGATKSGEPACRDTLVKNAPLAATTYEGGVNGRSTPGRLGPATHRFAGTCVIGFDAYCLADPVPDMNFPGTWLEPRWLRVHRNKGWRHTVSRWINGESDLDTFVSGGVVLPQHGVEYKDFERLEKQECGPQALSPPGPAILEQASLPDPKKGLTFTIQSSHALNFGLAVYIESVDPEYQYLQVQAGKSDQVGKSNPITWKYSFTAERLQNVHSRIVVLGTPCISTNIPAEPSTVATKAYDLGGDGALRPLPSVGAVDMERLQRVACLSPR